jgi:SAM-dependent methyltransferase
MNYRGFPTEYVRFMVCQDCLGDLSVDSNEAFLVNDSILCRKCKKEYEVKNGIIIFLKPALLDELRKSEIHSRDASAHHYDCRLAPRFEKEVVSTLRTIGNVEGKKVIEYGAGTGRLTKEYAGKAGQVIASDFSFRSLEILAENLPKASNVGLVCADATSLKLSPNTFDIAIATQFYEHLPSAELRAAFLDGCSTALVRGGVYVSTTYHYEFRMRMKGVPQEGMHQTGIFYHYFTEAELLRDLSPYFDVVNRRPIDITLPFEARLRLPFRLGGMISRFCERVPIIRNFGHLLLVLAKKKKV